MRAGKKHNPKPEALAVEDDHNDADRCAPPPVRFTVSASPLDDPSVRATLLSRPPAVLSQWPSSGPASAPFNAGVREDAREPGPEPVSRSFPAQEENLHARLRPAIRIMPPEKDTAVPEEVPLLLAVYVNGSECLRGAWLSLRPEADVLRLGRAPAADLALDDATVSRQHASVIRSGDGWVLRDEDSTCGTFVNGVRVTEARLRDGDRVRLGCAVLQAVFDPPIAARVSAIRAQLKTVDVLTGLATLQGFRAVLDTWADRNGPELAQLLLIVLDDPETIKAAHGDVVLDEVLVALAARLRSLLPHDAVGAHLIGGHFAWWVEPTQSGSVDDLTREVAEGVAAAPLALTGCSQRVTVSVFGTSVPRAETKGALILEELRALLRRAS